MQSLDRYYMIVPVPLDNRREREREFNQAFIIANLLKRAGGNPAIPIKNIIQKKKKTLPQSQLGRQERLENLNGAFRLRQLPFHLSGKKIMLVDDIFTTGSTINECAKLLKENEAEQVDFFTIARAQIS